MTTRSSIEWTDVTWNPTLGCSRVSAGCENCYAERFASRFRERPEGNPLVGLTSPRGEWTGEVRLMHARLQDPLKWKKPCRVFVDSMSDLFHERVPAEFISSVWRTMSQAREHTFQILTKRPERMARILRDLPVLPNVWLGTSVEDQRAAEKRIPALLETRAVVRFLSCEPLLGPLDLSQWLPVTSRLGHASRPFEPAFTLPLMEDLFVPYTWARASAARARIHWVIAGGESGPGARPMSLDWSRVLRDQCADADAAFFMKQVGRTNALVSNKGGELDDIPEDLRVRQMPRPDMTEARA